MKIKYVKGDATDPQGDGHKTIIHCSNDVGLWGAGFVLALSKRWPTFHEYSSPEYIFRKYFDINFFSNLGDIQKISTKTKGISVINMIGQRGVASIANKTPIDYNAIEECLLKVVGFCKENESEVHAPKFGCGLAGGDWNIIEHLINKTFIANGIKVTIYEF